MIFGDLNLGIDEFFVGMTGPINPGAVFMIQYDKDECNTREILDFINKEYVEEYSYDVLLPHYERTYNKGHVSGLNILFTEEFINNPDVKLCFNETEPFTLKHNDYLMFVISKDNKLYVSTVMEIEAEFMFNNWIVGELCSFLKD
ncbi:hypothetical protein [Methanobrevibacter smithii]|uniref:hypothetical protein n=1 Tax=Methanobrevibacter smithii TaxID=2173 RepID=UPI00207927DC|nr:hypothetical protein [Methanobrevibacter smithii]